MLDVSVVDKAATETEGEDARQLSAILTIRVTILGNILRLCQNSSHNPTPGSSREETKKRSRMCTVGAIRNGHISKRLATRQDLSLKKGPDFRRPGTAKVRVGVLAQLDYFLLADDPGSSRFDGAASELRRPSAVSSS
jgi:hypothetical protein